MTELRIDKALLLRIATRLKQFGAAATELADTQRAHELHEEWLHVIDILAHAELGQDCLATPRKAKPAIQPAIPITKDNPLQIGDTMQWFGPGGRLHGQTAKVLKVRAGNYMANWSGRDDCEGWYYSYGGATVRIAKAIPAKVTPQGDGAEAKKEK